MIKLVSTSTKPTPVVTEEPKVNNSTNSKLKYVSDTDSEVDEDDNDNDADDEGNL